MYHHPYGYQGYHPYGYHGGYGSRFFGGGLLFPFAAGALTGALLSPRPYYPYYPYPYYPYPYY